MGVERDQTILGLTHKMDIKNSLVALLGVNITFFIQIHVLEIQRDSLEEYQAHLSASSSEIEKFLQVKVIICRFY